MPALRHSALLSDGIVSQIEPSEVWVGLKQLPEANPADLTDLVVGEVHRVQRGARGEARQDPATADVLYAIPLAAQIRIIEPVPS